jgi:hypothetical protein
MNCITDSDLPVRIQAACALPELVRYERIRERMLPNLGRILQGTQPLAFASGASSRERKES